MSRAVIEHQTRNCKRQPHSLACICICNSNCMRQLAIARRARVPDGTRVCDPLRVNGAAESLLHILGLAERVGRNERVESDPASAGHAAADVRSARALSGHELAVGAGLCVRIQALTAPMAQARRLGKKMALFRADVRGARARRARVRGRANGRRVLAPSLRRRTRATYKAAHAALRVRNSAVASHTANASASTSSARVVALAAIAEGVLRRPTRTNPRAVMAFCARLAAVATLCALAAMVVAQTPAANARTGQLVPSGWRAPAPLVDVVYGKRALQGAREELEAISAVRFFATPLGWLRLHSSSLLHLVRVRSRVLPSGPRWCLSVLCN
jgi:hypothetical protein